LARLTEYFLQNILFVFKTAIPDSLSIKSSVPDPWHFGVEPDPDPRIHATDSNPDPDADPDPAIFFIDLQDASKKKQI
jgi:hypothetical protein